MTFLLSSWQCIFGNGCQGVLTEPAPELVQGCCSYGAHFSDARTATTSCKVAKAAHRRRVAVREAVGRKKGIYAKVGKDEDGNTSGAPGSSTTRASSSTGPASPTGPGCALHQSTRCAPGSTTAT